MSDSRHFTFVIEVAYKIKTNFEALMTVNIDDIENTESVHRAL
jgi:hypothetical protein